MESLEGPGQVVGSWHTISAMPVVTWLHPSNVPGLNLSHQMQWLSEPLSNLGTPWAARGCVVVGASAGSAPTTLCSRLSLGKHHVCRLYPGSKDAPPTHVSSEGLGDGLCTWYLVKPVGIHIRCIPPSLRKPRLPPFPWRLPKFLGVVP